MLSKLTIDNYALIENSIVNFKPGFTVITGETGSGKSIMLDALGLLMGERADIKALGKKDKKVVVEAIFTKPDKNLENKCLENGIDWDPNEIILRREISTGGKSRGFINDTPVNLTILSEIALSLLDIHSQHKNSLLNQPEEQLAIVDSYGHTQATLKKYQEIFKEYVSLRNKIQKIKENIARGKENKEFLMFRLENLNKLKPKRGELAELEREAEILGDADRIKTDLSEAFRLIGGSSSALKYIQNATLILENIDFDLLDRDNSGNLSERLETLKIELRDISDTLEGYAERIHADPERLEKLQERINSLDEAMRRYKVKDEDELVELHEQLKEELKLISEENTDISEMEISLKELARKLKEEGDKLSEERKNSAEKLASTIIEKIKPLGLPNVKFEVEIKKGKLAAEGQDHVTFLCSFNKNHPLQPVSEIASGGEISRVMLGIKSVMAQNMNLPTIIFDEIDTGVSGEIAHKMGRMMKDMAKEIQVISVTHLPQVAAMGDSHLKVSKNDEQEKTVSQIKQLSPQEREIEIAGMVSGTTINDAAIENARILLSNG